MTKLLALTVAVIGMGTRMAGTPVAVETLAGPDSDAVPMRCPYQFASDMPTGTFCVYRGTAFGRDGAVCETDVTVIWSAFASRSGDRREDWATPPKREVELTFVADPEMVIRAHVDSRRADRADVAGYTVGSAETTQALGGELVRRTLGRETPDVLQMELQEPGRIDIGKCSLVAYSGAFIGLLRARTAVNAWR